MHKQFILVILSVLKNRSVSINERGLTFTQWSVYNTDTKRIRYSSVPTSSITAEAVTVSGFAVSQKDFSGIVTTASRRYTATGMELAHTDGRGIVKTHSYESARGLLLGTTYSDSTTPRSYAYNHLGQLAQVVENARFDANEYIYIGRTQPEYFERVLNEYKKEYNDINQKIKTYHEHRMKYYEKVENKKKRRKKIIIPEPIFITGYTSPIK